MPENKRNLDVAQNRALIDIAKVNEGLAQLEQRAMDMDERLHTINANLDTIKADLAREIEAEEDDRGKKLYSNAESRKRELDARIAELPAAADVRAILEERRTLDLQVRDQERHLKYLYRVVDCLSVRMNAITSGRATWEIQSEV